MSGEMTYTPLFVEKIPRGLYSKVARRLDVTPTAVRLVALGHSKSAKIASELRREMRRLRRKGKPEVIRVTGVAQTVVDNWRAGK